MEEIFNKVLIFGPDTEKCKNCTGLKKCYFCGDKICCKKASEHLLGKMFVHVCRKEVCERKLEEIEISA